MFNTTGSQVTQDDDKIYIQLYYNSDHALYTLPTYNLNSPRLLATWIVVLTRPAETQITQQSTTLKCDTKCIKMTLWVHTPLGS